MRRKKFTEKEAILVARYMDFPDSYNEPLTEREAFTVIQNMEFPDNSVSFGGFVSWFLTISACVLIATLLYSVGTSGF